MSTNTYNHYNLLSVEDLISIIMRKDAEINEIKQKLKETKKLKEIYYAYNNFHIEEITRLDKLISQLKKQLN
tara:strand:- start:133 stop:348 length:216 start_codon:yes stop_codon:yes gene_type:complete